MNRVKINELAVRCLSSGGDSLTRLLLNIENDIQTTLDDLPLDTPVPKVKKKISRIFTKYIGEVIEEEIKHKKEKEK